MLEEETEGGGGGVWRGATGGGVRGHRGNVGDLRSFGANMIHRIHKRQNKKQTVR